MLKKSKKYQNENFSFNVENSINLVFRSDPNRQICVIFEVFHEIKFFANIFLDIGPREYPLRVTNPLVLFIGILYEDNMFTNIS